MVAISEVIGGNEYILASTPIVQSQLPSQTKITFSPTSSEVKVKFKYGTSAWTWHGHSICITKPVMVSETYYVDVCDGGEDKYRFGFNGQEKVNEMSGIGNHLEFLYRIQDTRIARFFSIDPLSKKFPWWTPYQFAGNTPIMAKDLEGAEIFIPSTMPITMPRPIILPRVGTIPRVMPPGEIVLPPVGIDIPEGVTVGQPQSTTAGEGIRKIEKSTGIDWENPPSSPDGLGEEWEELPNQAPNRRSFKNKENGEEIEFDKGTPGAGGWKGKDHWHRVNPLHKKSDGKKGKYLDKDGNPVNDGNNSSHIKPGTGDINILPEVIIIMPKRNWFQRNISDPYKRWKRERRERKEMERQKELEKWMV